MSKRLRVLFVATFSVFIYYGLINIQESSKPQYKYKSYIYGKWEGKFNDEELFFVFNKDNTCELNFKKSDDSSTLLVGKMLLDATKKPMALTVRDIQLLDYSLHSIIALEGKDILKMTKFAPISKFRPVSFEDNNTVYLSRYSN